MSEKSRVPYPSRGYKNADELRMENEEFGSTDFLKEIDDCVHMSTEGSMVVDFFKGKSVFITGGLGFLGQLTVEKLLRTCKDIGPIYLLIRSKGNKDATTRLEEAFTDDLFSQLLKVYPTFKEKLIAIEGDLSEPDLGISQENRHLLEGRVNIVIHCGASVKLSEELRFVAMTNIRGTNEIVKLVKNCKNLLSFVYVSTAYSHCIRSEIEEKVYDVPYTDDDILKLVETKGEDLDNIEGCITGKWPNSYTFSKAISENTVTRCCYKLPACIFRPGIIASTNREPLRGWINNYYGVVGILFLIEKGLLRCLNMIEKNLIDVVPGDYVANGVIVAAYNNQFMINENVKIYNFVSSPENPINQGDFSGLSQFYANQIPTLQSMWFPYNIYSSNFYYYSICSFFLHIIPAFLLDMILFVSGKKPYTLSTYKRIFRFTESVSFVTTGKFKFKNENVKELWDSLSVLDKNIFCFSMSKTQFNWNQYIKTCVAGFKLYLFKEDFDTISEARKYRRRLYYYHRCSQIVFILMIILFGSWIFSFF